MKHTVKIDIRNHVLVFLVFATSSFSHPCGLCLFETNSVSWSRNSGSVDLLWKQVVNASVYVRFLAFSVPTHNISTRVNASYTDWKRRNVSQGSRKLIVQFMSWICRDLGTCGVPSDDRHSRAITAHVAVCFHILGLVTWFDHTHNRWLGFKLRVLLVVHCFGALRCGGQSMLPVSRPFWSRYWWVHNKHSHVFF